MATRRKPRRGAAAARTADARTARDARRIATFSLNQSVDHAQTFGRRRYSRAAVCCWVKLLMTGPARLGVRLFASRARSCARATESTRSGASLSRKRGRFGLLLVPANARGRRARRARAATTPAARPRVAARPARPQPGGPRLRATRVRGYERRATRREHGQNETRLGRHADCGNPRRVRGPAAVAFERRGGGRRGRGLRRARPGRPTNQGRREGPQQPAPALRPGDFTRKVTGRGRRAP